MKLPFAILTLGLLSAFTNVNAQLNDEDRIKILPTSGDSFIKVLYALEIGEPVEIRFITHRGTVVTDKIKGGPYLKGVSKRYNVSAINNKDFWVEVSSPRVTVLYHLVPSADRKSFAAYLEKSAYDHTVVAKNN